jgi:uncharacterized repeat protein (TIGR01451 family)
MNTMRPNTALKGWGGPVAAAFATAICVQYAGAAAPAAGSIIGNQATASYTDGAGTSRTTTSNLVETVVAQKAGFTLTADQTKPTTPGSTVYFPHTLTNTGNGPDTLTISTTNPVGNGTFQFTNVVVYADANGDGVPDNFTPITTTPLLAAGQAYNVVIAGVVPSTATAGQTDSLTITTSSTFDPAQAPITNTDTVTLTNNAVLTVVKAQSQSTGAPGTTPVTFRLTYTNSGNATATNFVITDALDAGFAYVAGTGRWNVSGATALTDAVAGDPAGINYSFNAGTVSATIASVAPGVSGFIEFSVSVPLTAVPGNIPNTASHTYDPGNGVVTASVNTNTTQFLVTQVAGVNLADTGLGGVNSNTDGDAANNDIITVNTAVQGGVVTFENVVTNTGNGIDTYDMTFGASTFPVGTTFQFFKADGVTPLTDSSGSTSPDTGPVAPGSSVKVVVRAQLPASASTGGPFDLTKTATSVFNPAQSNSTTDRLLAITANTVDLTNDTAGLGAPGAGIGPEATPVTTRTVNPGQVATFTLVVANTSAVADAYGLQASTDSAFAALTLPAGWTVVFKDGTSIVTDTGNLAAGATKTITAEVTIPANQAPIAAPGLSVFFRALSPTSGASDRKRDAVIVNTVRDLAITPNGSNQTFPNGSVVYTHTVRNNGNVAEPTAVLAAVNSDAAWGSVLFFDTNGNGTLDAADAQIDNLDDIGGLAVGESKTIFVRVNAPSTATAGAQNTTTLTIDAGNAIAETLENNNTAADITTIITGDVSLTKVQALDAACDGTADGLFTSNRITVGAVPGACIIYQITATNSGSTPVTGVVISDNIPSLTTYETCAANACAAAMTGNPAAVAGTVTAPANGARGTVQTSATDLAPLNAKTLTFSVQIDQ